MARRRVIWFGFDGASRGFADHFIESGKMPALARLRDRGAFSESLPVPPCDTPTNWTALQTGAHAGTTEVVSFFTHRPGEPLDVAHSNLHSGAVKADTIWEALERQGRTPIVINWPCSWPSRLKRGIQINGTGPFTASWRLGFGRVYRCGDLGDRTTDPAIRKQFGGMSEEITLRPANDWRSAPASALPALETTIDLLGSESFRWTETGMQVTQSESGSLRGVTFEVLVTADTPDGYDRVFVAEERDVARAVELRPGTWSDWVTVTLPSHALFDQLMPEDRPEVEGLYRWKLVAMASDASTFALYRTDIWQADGWAHPPDVARSLRDAVGPYTEGLELAPPPSRLFDEWVTFHEQLAQAREWYVAAARYLATQRDWDLLALQLHIQDGINHILARDIIEEDSAYDPAKGQLAWQQLEAAYVETDRIIAGVLDSLADEDTIVCVVSDHGALPTFRQCLFSGALARAGLMAYRHDRSSGRWLVDWSQTKVFPRRGHVWVNRVGRDPDGIVSDEEYEGVRAHAISALLSITDDADGSRPVVAALRKEDAEVFGMWGDAVGDIITFVAPRYADSDADYASMPSDPMTMPDVGPTDLGCAHHPYLPNARHGIWSIPALFYLSGPGVKKGYERRHPISQVDVAPTLCHLLGIDPPRQTEGKVAMDMLE